MTIRYKLCTLLIMLLTASAQAAVNPPVSATPTAKAYFLDTVLWSYSPTTKTYNIPVCWEKFSQSTVAERANVTSAIVNTWQKYSLARFTGWGQCPLSPLIFNGIRITVDNFNGPRAALGTQGNGKVGVMRLNFRLTTGTGVPQIWTQCRFNFPAISLGACIQSTAIHEFGHILGLAHEQNRSDDPYLPIPILNPLCHADDPDPLPLPQGSFTTKGNTLFTDYDLTSVMNYCRSNYAGRTDLSPKDQLAIRVYYGQMPSYDSRTRILKVPRIAKYDGKIFTGTFKWISSNIWQRVGDFTATTTPSFSPAKLSSSGVLTMPGIKYINGAGHVNQILNGTFRPGLLKNYSGSWTRVQPLTFAPVAN
ncbi:M12 family metallopeptidase [Methyloglobulus sp.]|uniref:M12 family metallopeptidase n=1 Tax=Methyloglobulus sp. TaxID=2518622 RepID=UPI0032B7E863